MAPDPKDLLYTQQEIPGLQESMAPPAFSQQNVDLTEQLLPHFQALTNMSSMMLQHFQGIGDLLGRNVTNLDRTATSMNRINRFSTQEIANQRKIHDTMQARQKVSEKIQQAEGKNVDSLRYQFRLGDMMSKRGMIQYVAPGGEVQEISVPEYLSKPEAERQPIREQLATRIAGQPSQAFKITELLGYLAHGNIAAAIGESLQAAPFTGRIAEPLMRRSEALAARGGMLGTIGEGLTSAIPRLFSPVALYAIQREIRQVIGGYQADLRQGMQGGLQGTAAAGETFRASIRARVEALNPFDALTTAMAQEVQRGIQSEGFTGHLRSVWQDSVTDVIKTTGMDAGQALQLMSTSANQLGETANQFRQDMGLVETVAKQTSISVSQAAQSLQSLQTAFLPRAGAQSVGPTAQLSATLMQALPRAVTTRGTLATAIAQNWQTLVARAGINPATAFEPQILQQSAQILDSIAKLLWRIKNAQPLTQHMPLEEWVTWIEGASPGLLEALLPGASNEDIVAFMRRGGSRGGFEQVQRQNMAARARARAHVVHHHHSWLGSAFHAVASGAAAVGGAIGSGIDYADYASGKLFIEPTVDLFNRNYRYHMGHTFSRMLGQQPGERDVNLAATQRSYIESFKQQLYDLTPQQRQEVLAPLRRAKTYEELAGPASQEAQTIYIKMHPSAQNIFYTEPARRQAYNNYMRGQGSSQYMVYPVPGSR